MMRATKYTSNSRRRGSSRTPFANLQSAICACARRTPLPLITAILLLLLNASPSARSQDAPQPTPPQQPQYRVRVTADGGAQTRPLTIRMDPRLKGVTLANLRAQFDLATKIRDRTSAANDAVLRIRRLKSAVADRSARASAAEVKAAAMDVMRKLSAVEENLYQVRNRSGQDPLNFPIKLNNKLAHVLGVVQSCDNQPTAQSYMVYEDLATAVNSELKTLDKLLTTDLAASRVPGASGRNHPAAETSQPTRRPPRAGRRSSRSPPGSTRSGGARGRARSSAAGGSRTAGRAGSPRGTRAPRPR